ncbi:unnamed protein product [Mytilus edulis]|uniref:Uncharacterized protein n=1 Tax=Mytilus edulis TaxID=6550 RepID=A0A8S3USB6_MYTED|nr:unnamed protein product [Mytilus edulis]
MMTQSTSLQQSMLDVIHVNLQPSIALPIPSAGGGHSQCVVCKRRGPKLVVVPTNARFNIFLDKLIILTVGARCCPGHLCNDIFLPDALDRISHSQSSSIFNRTDLMDLITQIRDMALRGSKRRIDFDTENALTSSDILNLTGLSKENFNDLCSIVQKGNLRDSRTRSVRTCIGIFLTKLKSGLSNKLLSTLFNLGKDSVRRAIASARKYLSENFVPSNLGFNHISREEVITSHTRTSSAITVRKRNVSCNYSRRWHLYLYPEKFTIQVPT